MRRPRPAWLAALPALGVASAARPLTAQIGRATPASRFDRLHEDMKGTAGISMRAFVGARVFRFELATGEESTQFWFLIDQPF